MKPYNGVRILLRNGLTAEVMTAIGGRIRKLRQKRRMTQEELAEQVGINTKYFGEFERGTKSPTAVVVKKIAAALDAPVCSLLSAPYERACPCGAGTNDIGKLLAGRESRDVRRAVRIIEALLKDEDGT